MLEARALRGARVAITTAEQNVVGLAHRDPYCHDTNTNLAHELHPQARFGKRILASELTWARSECRGEAEARTN